MLPQDLLRETATTEKGSISCVRCNSGAIYAGVWPLINFLERLAKMTKNLKKRRWYRLHRLLARVVYTQASDTPFLDQLLWTLNQSNVVNMSQTWECWLPNKTKVKRWVSKLRSVMSCLKLKMTALEDTLLWLFLDFSFLPRYCSHIVKAAQ